MAPEIPTPVPTEDGIYQLLAIGSLMLIAFIVGKVR